MISAIYERRSIRKFLDKPISKEDIMDIIHSGVKAHYYRKTNSIYLRQNIL